MVIEKAADGSFSAYLPDLPGCVSCGDTIERVKDLIREATRSHVASLRDHREAVPQPTAVACMVEI